MNVICKKRGEGKTTELIKLSAAKNLIIITPTAKMADYIYEMAKDHGYEIPEPMDICSFISSKRMRWREPVLVDEALECLKAALLCPIEACSVSKEEIQ